MEDKKSKRVPFQYSNTAWQRVTFDYKRAYYGRRPVRWENSLERPNQAWVPRSYYALNRDGAERFVAFGSTGAAGPVVLASPSPTRHSGVKKVVDF